MTDQCSANILHLSLTAASDLFLLFFYSLQLRQDEESGELKIEWTSQNHVVQVDIGMVGVKGRMQALMPAIFARTPADVEQVEVPRGNDQGEHLIILFYMLMHSLK